MIEPREIARIEASLRDHDGGSCRDINFRNSTMEGVRNLIGFLSVSFASAEGHDCRGGEFKLDDSASTSAAIEKTGLIVHFAGGHDLFSRLQVMVAPEDPLFVEITFFPEYLLQSGLIGKSFILWIHAVGKIPGADRLYVRYENSSWRLGDEDNYSGVFYAADVEGVGPTLSKTS